jgi:hypothetical protein
MGIAFNSSVIKKAFMDNGQLDKDEEAIPSIEGLRGMSYYVHKG